MNNIKAFLKSHLNFLWEHTPLVLFSVLVGVAFLHMEKFAEFGYAILRLGVVVFVAFLIIHLVFKSTVRDFILSGKFKEEFDASPNKLWIALGTIAFVVWTAIQCFIHA